MKLYYFPTTCSLASHIALRETGLPFTLEMVNLMTGKTASGADFKNVNGNGYVPALELDDGSVMTESSAIMQYIANQKPESGLAPPAGSAEHYEYLQWMSFIATELHKGFAPVFNPAMPQAAREIAMDRLKKRFDWLAGKLAGKQYLVGSRFTTADGYLFTVMNWTNFARMDLSPWPAIQSYLAAIGTRPSVQEAMRVEGPPPPMPV